MAEEEKPVQDTTPESESEKARKKREQIAEDKTARDSAGMIEIDLHDEEPGQPIVKRRDHTR